MNNILVIGANGSMGKRYQAILKYLGKKPITSDIEDSPQTLDDKLLVSDGVIIATPTETHYELIDFCSDRKIPILCEKPLSKHPGELAGIKRLVESEKINLTMTMQYKLLDKPHSSGPSYYDYFRTGKDGLKWDCLQIIGLARGRVLLAGDSPIWKCTLNDHDLSFSDMDKAYVQFVKNWFDRPGDDLGKLMDIHQKVMEF